MYEAQALKRYFDVLLDGHNYFKMVQMTKRNPNAFAVMDQAQKIAGQMLVMSSGSPVEQVITNPALTIQEPDAFAIPGIQPPVAIQPPVTNDLAVLIQSVTKLTEKVDVLTSHSKKQNYRLNQLESERESESTPTPTS
jgi:hypothetical protein|tara:strand:- start:47 stop:460 length:414 start_codon:yes stop_codon:yes gene_type:complete